MPGFFVIQLDVTIVNVALPAIQRDVGGGIASLQWVVDAYTLALAAVMLTAGSTADRIGARRVFLAGLAAFGAGSAACAAAPGLGVLVGAGLAAAAGFVLAERHQRHPMLPLRLFRARAFSAATGVGVLSTSACTPR